MRRSLVVALVACLLLASRGAAAAPRADTALLLGFGLGYQVASAVDPKTWLLFPNLNETDGVRSFGAGVGVAFRIGE